MAIYSFQCSIIARSQKSNNAVGKAAYINRSDMKNDYDGTTWKYENRRDDVAYSAVMLPENCPSEFADPAVLWQTVENFEKRSDSRLARDFTIALPNEQTDEQNKALVEDFIKENFVDEGMVANFAIHKDKPGNKHVHIMTTTREVTAEGFAAKNNKGREWNKKENLDKWRQSFADIANKHLAKNNIDAKIDHRSLEAQKNEQLELASKAENIEDKYKHIAEAVKLDRPAQQRVSREEFENSNIQEERKSMKDIIQQNNIQIDLAVNNKIEQLKQKPKSDVQDVQSNKKRSSKMSILDTLSNMFDEFKNSISRVFQPEERQRSSMSMINKSSGSAKKKKNNNQDPHEGFNGNVIDAVQLREEAQLKNKAPKPSASGSKNKKDKDAELEKNNQPLFKKDDDKKLNPAQQFAKDKKIMSFAYQTDNLENFVVASEVAKNKRPNAMRAIGTIPKPNARLCFNNDNEHKNGFSKFMDKQNEKTEDRKATAEQKKKNDNQPKSMQDFEKQQNAKTQNRQNANNTQKSENKASAPKAPGK